MTDPRIGTGAGKRFVVVGGGIAGLAAAWDLTQRAPGAAVTVVEADGRLGGKLGTTELDGTPVDLAADAFLARRPEAVDLCRELGLADELVAPATARASVWARGRLRPLPQGQVLGVPTSLRGAARSGVLSSAGLARLAIEPLVPGRPLAGDAAVGPYLRRRLGREVHERLTDPLVGGINAGDTDHLSIDAVAPQLAAAGRRHRSLRRGLRAGGGGRPTGPATAASPVFLAHPRGMGHLVDVLVGRLAEQGVALRVGTAAVGIERRDDGQLVVTLAGSAAGATLSPGDPPGESASDALVADGVVLALPAPALATLLRSAAPAVAAPLAAVGYAGVVLVTLALPTAAIARLPPGSGFLVPRTEGWLLTAATVLSQKWAHLAAPDRALVRLSAGRDGDPRALALGDDELVARLRHDLVRATGVTDEPTATLVTRWPDSFPQYRPGHLERIATAEADLDQALPGVALAGAALGGVGIPACIGSGRRAVSRVLAHLPPVAR